MIIPTTELHKRYLASDACDMSEMTAGEWLRREMERRSITTHDVAEAVGLRDQAVYYWLTGRTSPKDEAAGKLAELLGIPEVDVRRRFGMWVPDEQVADLPPAELEELRELRKQLDAAIQRLEQRSPGNG